MLTVMIIPNYPEFVHAQYSHTQSHKHNARQFMHMCTCMHACTRVRTHTHRPEPLWSWNFLPQLPEPARSETCTVYQPWFLSKKFRGVCGHYIWIWGRQPSNLRPPPPSLLCLLKGKWPGRLGSIASQVWRCSGCRTSLPRESKGLWSKLSQTALKARLPEGRYKMQPRISLQMIKESAVLMTGAVCIKIHLDKTISPSTTIRKM